MDKRTLFGGGAAGAIVLMLGVGTWINQGTRPASSLDTPLPPGAVEVRAGATDQAIAPTATASVADAPSSPDPITSPTALPSPAASPTPASAEVVVFVSGAVKRPGVYHLKPGARIESAIFAAGGFKPNAQTDLINLADLAQDRDQIQVSTRVAPAPVQPARPVTITATARPSAVISAQPDPDRPQITRPKRGRVLGSLPAAAHSTAVASLTDGSSNGESGASEPRATSEKFKNPGDGVVNLNVAGAEELMRLPGVGPSMAAKIIAYREENGPFADISQLDDVKGIGPKTYAKMQPFLSVK